MSTSRVDFALRTARSLCADGPTLAAARAPLMDGAAGVATFLAEVARVLGERWPLDGARRQYLRSETHFVPSPMSQGHPVSR